MKWPIPAEPSFQHCSMKVFPRSVRNSSLPPYSFVYELNCSPHSVKPQPKGHVSHSSPLYRSCTASTRNAPNQLGAHAFCWMRLFLVGVCVSVHLCPRHKYVLCLYVSAPFGVCFLIWLIMILPSSKPDAYAHNTVNTERPHLLLYSWDCPLFICP